MVEYTVEPKAMEHRCQCCGELADDVFCDDCKAHMSAEARAAEAEAEVVPPAASGGGS
jgi:hypothetical protein